MALGVNFLSKTKIGGMKDIMGTKTQQTGANQNTGAASSVFNAAQAENPAKKQDVTKMNSTELLNYVYNNGFKNNDIKLPATVEFDGQKFPTNGDKFNHVVSEICKQTGASEATVEAELKKKYIAAGGGGGKGASLNMQA